MRESVLGAPRKAPTVKSPSKKNFLVAAARDTGTKTQLKKTKTWFWTNKRDPAAKQRNEKQIGIENLDGKNRCDWRTRQKSQNFGQF
jgi:hypothetical protein